jgi:Fe-S cluster biogenesis protein NfuA
MNVTFETTPNPSTMKFNFTEKIAESTHDFSTIEHTENSPLAAKIFGFPWVSSVFIGENFVTITKQDWVDWKVIAEPLSGLLKEHVQSGHPVVLTLAPANDESQTDSEIVKKIKRVLQNEIRPVVALDGGDILFVKFENQKLYIKMLGACSGCPSSTATLKQGIEVRIKEVFPDITEVISIN